MGFKAQPLTKRDLILVLGVSKSTLNRRMKYLIPKILEIDPRYDENAQQIRKDVFILICDDFGWARETVLFRIKTFIPEYKEFDLYTLSGITGIDYEHQT